MLAGLWRRAVRGPWGRRTHPGPGGGTPRSGADGGFTLVEVIVSISLMTITMTALTTFFVLTGSSAAHQSGSQAAAQLAQDAMDQARSLKGSAVITGTPENLMSALQKIASGITQIPQRDLREVAGMNAFFIIPTTVKQRTAELFMDHPPLEKRLAALAEIAREMGRPVA